MKKRKEIKTLKLQKEVISKLKLQTIKGAGGGLSRIEVCNSAQGECPHIH
ncbi:MULTISPECIES: hypothetical protein [Aquimarina]|nr:MULTISPECIES: hypothetical protein [Aquimarina]